MLVIIFHGYDFLHVSNDSDNFYIWQATQTILVHCFTLKVCHSARSSGTLIFKFDIISTCILLYTICCITYQVCKLYPDLILVFSLGCLQVASDLYLLEDEYFNSAVKWCCSQTLGISVSLDYCEMEQNLLIFKYSIFIFLLYKVTICWFCKKFISYCTLLFFVHFSVIYN